MGEWEPREPPLYILFSCQPKFSRLNGGPRLNPPALFTHWFMDRQMIYPQLYPPKKGWKSSRVTPCSDKRRLKERRDPRSRKTLLLQLNKVPEKARYKTAFGIYERKYRSQWHLWFHDCLTLGSVFVWFLILLIFSRPHFTHPPHLSLFSLSFSLWLLSRRRTLSSRAVSLYGERYHGAKSAILVFPSVIKLQENHRLIASY